jgi:hypothetical protein
MVGTLQGRTVTKPGSDPSRYVLLMCRAGACPAGLHLISGMIQHRPKRGPTMANECEKWCHWAATLFASKHPIGASRGRPTRLPLAQEIVAYRGSIEVEFVWPGERERELIAARIGFTQPGPRPGRL